MKDKLRKYLSVESLKYVFSSVMSVLTDNGIYFLLLSIFGLGYKELFQATSTFLSSIVNFNLNKFWVFEKKGTYWKDCFEYYCVCVPRTLLSILFTHLLQNAAQAGTPVFATILKMIVDLILFILAYFIQKKWVFNN